MSSTLDKVMGYSSMNRHRNTVHDVFDIQTPAGAFLAAVHGHGYKLFDEVYHLEGSDVVLTKGQYDALAEEDKNGYVRDIKYTELYNVLTTYGNQKIDAAAGAGKALMHGEYVLTYEGYRPVEDIEIGDLVYGRDGRLHKVVGVYPQGKKRVYEVVFSDGNSVYCSGNHIWRVSKDLGETWVDTETVNEDMMLGSIIPMTDGVVYPNEDWDGKIDADLSLGYIRKIANAPLHVRRQYVEMAGESVSFTDNEAIDAFVGVCESVGRMTDVKHADAGMAGEVNVLPDGVCHQIMSIRVLDDYRNMTCIEVDSPDHLFLMKNCIVTHNTTSLIFKIMYDIVTGEAMTMKALPNGSSVPMVDKMWVCTFLRSGAKDLDETLSKWQRKLGYRQTSTQITFSTLDAEFKRCLNAMGADTPIGDTTNLLKKAITACNITRNGNPLKKEDYQIITGIVTYFRGRLDSKRYEHPACKDYGLTPNILNLLVKQFASLKTAEGVMDFDDVQELLYKYLYVEPNKHVQDFVQSRYNYIYIDEFQDTSQMQYAILKFYARGKLWMNRDGSEHDDDILYTGEETKGKIVVIGDVSQCITDNTPITMENGEKPAQDVQVLDVVKTPCGTGVVNSVTKTVLSDSDFISLFVTSSGKEFGCTDGHKVFARLEEGYDIVYLGYSKELDKYDICATTSASIIGAVGDYKDKIWILKVVKSGTSDTIGICDAMRTTLKDLGVDAVFSCNCTGGFSLPYYTSKDMGAVLSYSIEEMDKVDDLEGYYDGTQVVRRMLVAGGSVYHLVSASQVHEGMHVWTEDGDEVIKDKFIGEGEGRTVYDFDIEGSHVFYAGGVLVHNCIYSFKGSDSKILAEQFDNDFRPVNSHLSCNWRCPSNILTPVVPSIHLNSDSADQGIYSSSDGGEFHAYAFGSTKSMGDKLKDDLNSDMDNNYSVAILCRTNFDGMIPAFLLEASGRYNFSVSGENMTLSSPLPRNLIKVARMFTDKSSPAVKNTLGYLINYNEQRQLTELMNTLKANNKSVWDLPEDDLRYSVYSVYNMVKDIKPYFYDNGKRVKENEIKALEALYWVVRQRGFGGDSTYCDNARACIDVLLYILQNGNFTNVHDFIEEMELVAEKLNGRVRANKAPIHIATVHEFKGKEADSVYVWNDSEGVFPSGKCDELDMEQLEEERRVHYIACTRARKIERIYTMKGEIGRFLWEMDCTIEKVNPKSVALGGN